MASMLRTRVLWIGVALLVSIAALYSSTRIGHRPSSRSVLDGFVSWDSGLYPAPDVSWPQWLDDNTLVILGYPNGKPRTFAEARQMRQAVIVWHLGDQPKAYTDSPWLDTNKMFICAADGVLVYPLADEVGADGKKLIKIAEGPLGHLTARTVDDPGPRSSQNSYPSGSGDSRPCDFYHDSRMAGHTWVTDHDREHYLDFGPYRQFDSDDPILLMSRAGQNAPVSLPVMRRQAPAVCAQYHRFDDLFYLRDCTNSGEPWSAKNPCSVYWTVDPKTAKVEKYCIAFDPTVGGIPFQMVPTKRGVFFASSQNMTRDQAGTSGLFFAGSEKNKLVVPGFVQNVTVSPNGCRLAFRYARELRDIEIGTSGNFSIVVIDVCQKRP